MLLNTGIPFWLIEKIRLDLLSVLIIGWLVHAIIAPYRDMIPAIPIIIPAFIGTVMSVILSFKPNKSYDHWWGARKIRGAIVNGSRRFLLQLQPTDTSITNITRAIKINSRRLPGEKEVLRPVPPKNF